VVKRTNRERLVAGQRWQLGQGRDSPVGQPGEGKAGIPKRLTKTNRGEDDTGRTSPAHIGAKVLTRNLD